MTGCVSYSTLQTAKTIEPGKEIGGVGVSSPHTDKFNGVMLEINILAASSEVFVIPAHAGIQSLDSGFRRNDDASVEVLNLTENKSSESHNILVSAGVSPWA